MADAATSLGVTIQYCMPLPRHMLESTHHQAVTNARASGDYHPGAGNFDISQSSLFYWALGAFACASLRARALRELALREPANAQREPANEQREPANAQREPARPAPRA
jgi:hypothetical protein